MTMRMKDFNLKDIIGKDSSEQNDVQVEVALQYTSAYSENILSFVNNIHTAEGGTHLDGFKKPKSLEVLKEVFS